MLEDAKFNYHGVLGQFKDDFDAVIKKMRDQMNHRQEWKKKSYTETIKNLAGNFKYATVLSKLKLSALPIIGGGLTWMVAYVKAQPWWAIGLCVAGVVILFLLSIYYFQVKKYQQRMATIHDPAFHLGALEALRPKEYEFWERFIGFDYAGFSFNGLYDALASNMTDAALSHVAGIAKGSIQTLQDVIEAQESDIEVYKASISVYEGEISEYEKAVSHLVKLLKSVNTNVYRLVNQRLSLHDLDFILPFTIYWIDGDKLRLIMDKGTSGASKETLSINDSNELRYAAVVAALNPSKEGIIKHTPYPGRNILAFTMRMQYDEYWVWSFHYDDDDYVATLFLNDENGIIESKEIRRLIHAFCLVLQSHRVNLKEDGHDVHETDANMA
ncbi:hypothetical protein ACE41H_15700 [Paenibacillus enshidis]|uniref:EF-hand domain-containing protein n=1 Tax=Paenibacillus enshidis TaxID=1458439 RepID=A0ABV5AYI1_9BACL